MDLTRMYHELVRFETELWDAVDARLRADHDLPLGRFESLRIVGGRGACRVQDIAEDLAITVGGTSKVVDRLEAAGLCRRRGNPDDRRSSLIELTAAGRRLLAKASVSFDDELERRVGTVITPRALQQLTTTLTRLRAAGHDLDTTPEPKA